MSLIALSAADLALASLLLLLNGLISVAFGLRLERSLAVAAIRLIVQVGAVGFALAFVLRQASPWWTALVALVLVAAAGYETIARQERRFQDWWACGLGNVTLLLVGGLATLYAVAIVGPSSWYDPRYVIPILAMVLGSTLTAVSLALQILTEGAERERAAIEARMALGASRFEAFASVLRQALRGALLPLFNTMSLAGLITLPGMMTGQILAGADAALAAKYQIVIMLIATGAAGLGALLAGFGGVLLLTDQRHRLRLDRLALAR